MENSQETVPQVAEETLDLSKAENVQPKELPAEVQAALYLQQAIPLFRKKLHDYSITGNQAKRILEAIIETPLEKEAGDFTTPEAYNLFRLGLTIQNAKFILFNTSLKMEEEKQVNAEVTKEEQTSTPPEETI